MNAIIASLSLAERVLTAAFCASAGLLIGAHLFEHVGGFVPCILCLDQREAHWTALGVATAGLIASRIFKSRLGATATLGAAALVYAVSIGLAFYHTGVEWKFWPGPAICAGGGPVDIGSIVEALDQKTDAPACDDVQWRFLGLSMAGYNLVISAGLFAMVLLAALSETRDVKISRKMAGAKTP